MTTDDHEPFRRALCSRWQGKFNKADLDFWSAKLGHFLLSDIEAALTRFKNTKRFTPKVDDILELLPASAAAVAANAKRREGPEAGGDDGGGAGFVEMVKSTTPWLKEEQNGVAVILRFYRSLYHLAAGRNPVNDPQEAYRRKCERALFGLALEGSGPIDEPTASRLAEYIFAPPDAFRMCLADVRGDVYS